MFNKKKPEEIIKETHTEREDQGIELLIKAFVDVVKLKNPPMVIKGSTNLVTYKGTPFPVSIFLVEQGWIFFFEDVTYAPVKSIPQELLGISDDEWEIKQGLLMRAAQFNGTTPYNVRVIPYYEELTEEYIEALVSSLI